MSAIALKNVRKEYSGRTVLDIDFLNIERGERVAIAGQNGSGKTTLLSIAALLLNPESGEIYIDGEKVTRRNTESFRSKISFMAQEPYFFTGSLKRNMEFALSGSKNSKDEMNERIGKYLNMLGISEYTNRPPRTLSTGEKKRAAIARALCRETQILLLDEPFTHVDSLSSEILEQALSRLPKNRTVVFSTHNLSQAHNLAERIITLDGGILSPWSPDNLLKLTAYPSEDGTELRSKGGLSIYYPEVLHAGHSYMATLNAHEILLSRKSIETSAQNNYLGRIKKIEGTTPNTVMVTVECPPDLNIRAMLTERSIKSMEITVGDAVWVHFKSTAIHILNNSTAGMRE